MVLRLEVSIADAWKTAFPDAKKVLVTAAKAAFTAAKTDAFPAENAEISFLLTSDEEIRALNAQYRQQDKPTNVLSFAALDDGFEPAADGTLMLGDVVVALETTQREAVENKQPFSDHFSHLIVHGVLHLLGFDHMDDADADEMESLETTILKGLNIDNPYAIDD